MLVSLGLSYQINNLRQKEIRAVFGYVEEVKKTRINDMKLNENENQQKNLIMKIKKERNVEWVF